MMKKDYLDSLGGLYQHMKDSATSLQLQGLLYKRRSCSWMEGADFTVYAAAFVMWEGNSIRSGVGVFEPTYISEGKDRSLAIYQTNTKSSSASSYRRHTHLIPRQKC